VSGALKAAARAAVDRHAEELIALSERLHAGPETAWEEHRAAASVPGLLDRAGFDVTAAYLGLDTAFHARFGSGPVRIALCAEYDALPHRGEFGRCRAGPRRRRGRRRTHRRGPTAPPPRRAVAGRSRCSTGAPSPASTSP
jgi:metal-dependent amidase/aminoacylase/carboxypeptidase family protein